MHFYTHFFICLIKKEKRNTNKCYLEKVTWSLQWIDMLAQKKKAISLFLGWNTTDILSVWISLALLSEHLAMFSHNLKSKMHKLYMHRIRHVFQCQSTSTIASASARLWMEKPSSPVSRSVIGFLPPYFVFHTSQAPAILAPWRQASATGLDQQAWTTNMMRARWLSP